MEERKAHINLKFENKDKPKVKKDLKPVMNDDKTDLESRGSRMQDDPSFFGKSIPMNNVLRAQSVMPPTIKSPGQLGHSYNKQHSAMDAMLIGKNNRPRF